MPDSEFIEKEPETLIEAYTKCLNYILEFEILQKIYNTSLTKREQEYILFVINML